ncbi:hypothetical protein KJ966_30955 [bacterium]|nr:hypothetical protein [bacterium]
MQKIVYNVLKSDHYFKFFNLKTNMDAIPILIDLLTKFLNFFDDLSFTISFFVIAYLLFRQATKEIRENEEQVERTFRVFIKRKYFSDKQFFLYRLSFVIFCWPLYKIALYSLLGFLHTLVPATTKVIN